MSYSNLERLGKCMKDLTLVGKCSPAPAVTRSFFAKMISKNMKAATVIKNHTAAPNVITSAPKKTVWIFM